jgi:hypothetical protein
MHITSISAMPESGPHPLDPLRLAHGTAVDNGPQTTTRPNRDCLDVDIYDYVRETIGDLGLKIDDIRIILYDGLERSRRFDAPHRFVQSDTPRLRHVTLVCFEEGPQVYVTDVIDSREP